MSKVKKNKEQKEIEKLELKKQEEAQRKIDNRNHFLKELIEVTPQSGRSPIFKFEIGQKVLNLNKNQSEVQKIIDVQENGSFLLLENDDYYISHMKVIPESEIKNIRQENFSYRDLSAISFHNTVLTNLLSYYYKFGIDMSPIYQRDLVWTLEDKQSLINSIFNNIEIGKFVLIERDYKPNQLPFEILDGKQRLNALTEFVENKFQYQGYYYYQLSSTDRNHFEHYSLTYGVSKKELSLEQKCMYFLKLNTQGKPQSQEHLNKVLDMLKNEQSKKS